MAASKMQVIPSAGHETRPYSYRPAAFHDEETPLLRRMRGNHDSTPSNTFNTIVITLLIIILVSGVVIGIYLLILQSRAENVLPPMMRPLQLVSRDQWDQEDDSSMLAMCPSRATDVIVVQTDSSQCYSSETCRTLLHEMVKRESFGRKKALPYSFLISSNGQAYESLGWLEPSPLFSGGRSNLVIGFIGNFTRLSPTGSQLLGAKNLIAESISQQFLSPAFNMYGKNTRESPKVLFGMMEMHPQWRKDLSD